MQQFSFFKNKKQSQKPRRKSQDPVLSAEDEAFLQNVTSDLSTQSPSAQEQIFPSGEVGVQPQPAESGVQSPKSPVEEFGRELGEEERRTRSEEETGASSGAVPTTKVESASQAQTDKKKKPWSWSWRKAATEKKDSKKDNVEADVVQITDLDDKEADQEKQDMIDVLERLNLAADNNKVFSIGDETQELLRKFKLIFKDLVNGVPTAYRDLEMLLTNGNKQLQDTYSQLPTFLQKLIEKLPERWTESLAPEMLAAASARASQSGINVDNIGKAAAAANKMGLQVPSLKELVGKPAALVGMLRSIVAFLRARFPAVLGMNVLWSLALFILLFVLWYCHKRGREVRLENERLVTEAEISKMNEESSDGIQIRSTETLTTTAPQGASSAEVREGIKAAQQARETKAASENVKQENANPDKNNEIGNTKSNDTNDTNTKNINNDAPKPTRSKSILGIWRSNPQPATPKATPYPGT